MDTIRVNADFSSITGVIKPMHSVNNGPASLRGNSSDKYFRDAGIPFARNHDANFAPAYGAPHTVDIIAIVDAVFMCVALGDYALAYFTNRNMIPRRRRRIN